MVVQVLPRIVTDHEYNPKLEPIERLRLARVNLYDHFIGQWFERQKQKLVNGGLITEVCPIEEAYRDFCKELAHEMLQANMTSITYEPIEHKKTKSKKSNLLAGATVSVVSATVV